MISHFSYRDMDLEEYTEALQDRSPAHYVVQNTDCFLCRIYAQEGHSVERVRLDYETDTCPYHDDPRYRALVDATRRKLARTPVLLSENAPTLRFFPDDPRPICERCATLALTDESVSDHPVSEYGLLDDDLEHDARWRALIDAAELAIRERYSRFRETGNADSGWTLKAALPTEKLRGWYEQGEAHVAACALRASERRL